MLMENVNMQYTISNITPEKVDKGEAEIRKAGGTVYADNSFEVQGVNGSFELINNTLTVTITDKPWLVSWNMIKQGLIEYFG